MTEKRFRVTIGNENSVSFIDTQQNKRFLYIKFHTEKDAIDCKNALMYQCSLLNEQHETIQQSRKELSDYSCTIIQLQDKVDVREALLKQLEDENEQLKVANGEMEDYLARLEELSDIRLKYVEKCAKEKVNLVDWCTHLEKENEQLKQNIQEAYKNERTELGKSVLKQLIEGLE